MAKHYWIWPEWEILRDDRTRYFPVQPVDVRELFTVRSADLKIQLEWLKTQKKHFILWQRIVNELADIRKERSFWKYIIQEKWFRTFIYENLFLVMPLLEELKSYYSEKKQVLEAESDEHDYVWDDQIQKSSQNWLWKIENATILLNNLIQEEVSKLSS